MNHRFLAIHEIILLVAAIAILGLSEVKESRSKHSMLLMPPKTLKFFGFGYREILGDLLWIRYLQDIDLCGDAATLHAPDSVAPNKVNAAKCENGWSARMLDAVTELAPRFKMPYMVGGTILSGVVHDNVGAARIFKKGVEQFPDDWEMSYRAAFHYMSAFADYKTAANYLIYAGKHGAPGWVFGLAARLETRLGQAILAKPVLEEAIAADPDSDWAAHLKKRLAEINETIAKGNKDEK